MKSKFRVKQIRIQDATFNETTIHGTSGTKLNAGKLKYKI